MESQMENLGLGEDADGLLLNVCSLNFNSIWCRLAETCQPSILVFPLRI